MKLKYLQRILDHVKYICRNIRGHMPFKVFDKNINIIINTKFFVIIFYITLISLTTLDEGVV